MIELTAAGLTTQTEAEIFAELLEAMKSSFGVNLTQAAAKVLGNFCAVMAEREALCHEAILASHQALDPDAAEDAAQDSLCAITGTVREPASKSTVTLTCTGTNGTALSAGRQVSVGDTEEVFVTTALATLATLTSWASSTAYTVGQRRTNGGNSYVCITAGTSASSGGPTTEADDITDGSVHWRYMGGGAAAADVEAESAVTGAVQAVSGSITTIETPVAGWTGVINLLDATPGTARESNAALRIRRELELFTQADAVLGAIYAAVLRVDGVTAATVFQNTSPATADGMPPHSVEAVVTGGDDQDIVDALFASVGAGIKAYGNTSGVAVDPNGDSQAVGFSRAVQVPTYETLTVVVDRKVFPADGEDLIKAAIVAAGDLYPNGEDLAASALIPMVFGACPGVKDVPLDEIFIGTAPSPASNDTIAISKRQVATFDTSRIELTLITWVP